MAEQKVLIPYNFSVEDEKSLDFAIRRFSGDEQVAVTLFHVYAPVPDIEMRNNPIMERMMSNLSYLRQKLRDQEEELKAVRDRLVTDGFSEARADCMFQAQRKSVPQDIIDQVMAEGYQAVVMARTPASIVRFFTPSISAKVAAGLRENVRVFMVT